MPYIRPVTEADLPDVLTMVHSLAKHHGDPVVVTIEDLRRDVLGANPWVRVLVAEGQGYVGLCPLAQLQFGVRGMDIHHLFIAGHARRQGVGRALIEAAIALSRTLGCKYIMVGAHPDNIDAQAAYRAVGFEEYGAGSVRFRMKI